MTAPPIGVRRAQTITGQEATVTPQTRRLIRVAVINDYEIVVTALAATLARFSNRIHLCEVVTHGEPIEGDAVDVALFDTFGRQHAGRHTLRFLTRLAGIQAVALFTADITDRIIDEAFAAGARAVISKAVTGDQLADAIERVASGERLIYRTAAPEPSELVALDWPGRARGLTLRESEVLALVAGGHTNRQVADALYLGEQTVKSHLRSVYAKLDVHNRVQAARIALEDEGFRTTNPPPV